MKILRCTNCTDMVVMREWMKSCKCGQCYGMYLKDHRTVLTNLTRFGQMLGVDNNVVYQAPYFTVYRDFKKEDVINPEIQDNLIKETWLAAEAIGCGGLNNLALFLKFRDEENNPVKAENFLDSLAIQHSNKL